MLKHSVQALCLLLLFLCVAACSDDDTDTPTGGDNQPELEGANAFVLWGEGIEARAIGANTESGETLPRPLGQSTRFETTIELIESLDGAVDTKLTLVSSSIDQPILAQEYAWSLGSSNGMHYAILTYEGVEYLNSSGSTTFTSVAERLQGEFSGRLVNSDLTQTIEISGRFDVSHATP